MCTRAAVAESHWCVLSAVAFDVIRVQLDYLNDTVPALCTMGRAVQSCMTFGSYNRETE